MARAPTTTPSLDQLATVTLADPEPAQILHVQQIDRRQHALMSAWGGPPTWCGVVIDETESALVGIRVPPGVTHVEISALLSGKITVDITTPPDSTGTRLELSGGLPDTLAAATMVHTVGKVDASEGADSGRAVIVRSPAAWTWVDTHLTITAGGAGGHLWGLIVRPIHESQ